MMMKRASSQGSPPPVGSHPNNLPVVHIELGHIHSSNTDHTEEGHTDGLILVGTVCTAEFPPWQSLIHRTVHQTEKSWS